MLYKIVNNHLFIDTPNQKDQSQFVLYSKLSHINRKILSVVLRLFCGCCCPENGTLSINDRLFFNHSFFTFETFKVKVDGRQIYVNKQAYYKWRFPQLHHAPRNFSEDFLNQIKAEKNPPIPIKADPIEDAPLKQPPAQIPEIKAEPATKLPLENIFEPLQIPNIDVEPIKNLPEDNKKEEIVPEKKEEIPLMDEKKLIHFFQNYDLYEGDNKWNRIIPSLKNNEIFQAAVDAYLQMGLVEGSIHSLGWFKGLYPLLDHDQKEFLIDKLKYPGDFVCCFPEDKELLAKIAEKIFIDTNKLSAFFRRLNKGNMHKDYIDAMKSLIKAVIAKIPQDYAKIHQEVKKDNLFGFKQTLISEFDCGIVPLILEDLPAHIANPLLSCSVVYRIDFGFKLGMEFLQSVFKTLNKDKQLQDVVSDQLILFSLAFLEELVRAKKAINFLTQINFDVYKRVYKSEINLFINCCIIAAFKHRAKDANKILNFIKNCGPLLQGLRPTETTPNPILEAHLTLEEKKRFLEWTINVGLNPNF